MWRKPFSEGALLCGICDGHAQVKTVGTRRAGFLPSLQHLLDEAGRRTALTIPPCSCHLIWQTAARSPVRNLRYFCPLPTQTGGAVRLRATAEWVNHCGVGEDGRRAEARRFGADATRRQLIWRYRAEHCDSAANPVKRSSTVSSNGRRLTHWFMLATIAAGCCSKTP